MMINIYKVKCCLALGLSITILSSCSAQQGVTQPVKPPTLPIAKGEYINPVFTPILADPSIIKDPKTGMFYGYGTEDNWGDGNGSHLVAVVKSKNLKDWIYVNDAFVTKPNWKANGGIWAPDVNYIDGKFYMYYSYSVWADANPGIGLAIADKAEGPFVDAGKLFTTAEIGTPAAIDPFYISEGGKKYLFYGSYSDKDHNGTWAVELAADGKSVPDLTKKTNIAAGDFEGVMIYKRGDYYYFFGSKNNCCDGAASIYQVRVGRSANLLGPYLDKDGNKLTVRGSGTLLIKRNDRFAGPGHNAPIMRDDAGTDWFLYHAIESGNPTVPTGANRRVLMLDKLTWNNGWPEIKDATPSVTAQQAPVFN
ncbi:family 43 glycosylhydrolase [Mucilaginibacter pocheonensis]|uniref:Arabinan endo-1,5-alpha-L-arabinosidase n=1 Tax=Mucilaginibacter pocheonensis TaxID=398050 RepID=A0ABU1T8E6_9SPHI|nr:family 43 glycosylhydrolase [Mucilaginibacter pocheonensis]MDR6941654.1 arabinan endo-1,5-alpha-L-arabinosidase [Mucilaginibacter pocheonensis]